MASQQNGNNVPIHKVLFQPIPQLRHTVAVIVVRLCSPLLQCRYAQRARQCERESVRATIKPTGRHDDRASDWETALVASSGRHAEHPGCVAILYRAIDRNCDWALAADHPVVNRVWLKASDAAMSSVRISV